MLPAAFAAFDVLGSSARCLAATRRHRRDIRPAGMPCGTARGKMTADRGILSRRTVLRSAVAASATALGGAGAETALVGPEGDPAVIVAGPDDSETAAWARMLLPSLAAGMMGGPPLKLRYAGGRDGVTGANQFDARAMANGSQALLFPGCAAIAWMAGDSRAQFDIGHFLPLLALASTDVVMLRGGLNVPNRARPVRLPCGFEPQPAHTALMALDLLEIDAVPVPAAPDPLAAVRQGTADAVFVRGCDVPNQVRALTEAGLMPAFTAGMPVSRDAAPAGDALYGVPHLLSLLAPAQRSGDSRVTAWRAVAAASALDLVLALPRLSTASSVARWRRACSAGLANLAIGRQIVSRSLLLLSDQETATAMRLMRADVPAQLTLRRWLADRLNWRPA